MLSQTGEVKHVIKCSCTWNHQHQCKNDLKLVITFLLNMFFSFLMEAVTVFKQHIKCYTAKNKQLMS